METIAGICIWTALSLATAFVAFRYCDGERKTHYAVERVPLAACYAVCVVVSLAVAYAASSSAASPIAYVELGACYIAVLASALIDVRRRVIPNAIPAALVCIRIACFVYEYVTTDEALGYLVSSLIGCLFCFLVLTIASKVAHGGIGGGDVKLVSAMGLMCGLYFILYTLAFALAACGVVAAVLIALKKRERTDSLPFAPFLYVGFVAAVFVSML